MTRSATGEVGLDQFGEHLPDHHRLVRVHAGDSQRSDDIFLYLDQPSPGSGCSGGPGGFGSLTDTGNGSDCLTVTVVNNVAVGGTGASDHAVSASEIDSRRS